jgi:hypothetical protein
MAAIRRVGELGMIDTVEIYHQSVDVGLDESDDPYGSSTSFPTTVTSTTKGWLVGEWSRVRNTGIGDIDTTTNYRLRLPVGTTIAPGDRVSIHGNFYSVFDAGTDQTWPEWLVCVVRRSK